MSYLSLSSIKFFVHLGSFAKQITFTLIDIQLEIEMSQTRAGFEHEKIWQTELELFKGLVCLGLLIPLLLTRILEFYFS